MPEHSWREGLPAIGRRTKKKGASAGRKRPDISDSSGDQNAKPTVADQTPFLKSMDSTPESRIFCRPML